MSRRRPGSSFQNRHDEHQAAERSEVRAAVQRFLLMGLVALVLVAVPVALWVRAQSEANAMANAVLHTQRLADYSLGPLITDGVVAGDPGSTRRLDERLAPRLADGSLVRIKVWDANGKIVYSDLPLLVGQNFALPNWAPELLAGGQGRATLETQTAPDDLYETDSGELVEVYVRSIASNGNAFILEAYFNDDALRHEQDTVLLGLIPAFLLSLGALQLAQLIPAVQLARRIQNHQSIKRKLLQHAIDASDLERQRIARDLHDEVIQDLAGLSYALEAEERHSAPENRALFGQAKAILQKNVRTLRAMTTELYPPDLEELGLPAALTRLTAPLLEQGIEVKLHVPANCDLDRDRAAMFYRVAREVLANTVKHAKAGVLELTLMQDDDRTILLIHDNGCGFDLNGGAPDNHLGLRIMRDTIHVAGGSLEVRSWMGGGTSVMATLDRVAPVRSR
ncbi:Histidine kinase-, DNA gyrase B-, and HSP90-like ATPase [Cryobacterium flavum]|uniref:Histidine kinase-, DNA gyrase B-, and HSP90-like ATPase n=1 Tax=Cryobacterium flavum TaxID=1424659 RepID=A0A4R8V603_9MICO|nr:MULTISPECIES: histidine kinase [Cryobacterium]TFB77708.1 sensor histidine kinase [Cryobacterium flavum]SDM55464.1 Histidine kinase-, DNA gyrase B-, and HSP90-like ATPase [Cryobacterium flavum]